MEMPIEREVKSRLGTVAVVHLFGETLAENDER